MLLPPLFQRLNRLQHAAAADKKSLFRNLTRKGDETQGRLRGDSLKAKN